MLSDEEKEFIIGGVQGDRREDGRSWEEYRVIEVECGLVSHTNGSARLRLGETDILVGVKAEIVQPLSWKPEEGTVEFFVDCSAHANPDFEGHGGEDLALELASIAEHAIRPGLDLKQLCIRKEQQCWCLNIDAVVLQCGGSVCDVLCMAIVAALHDTRLPDVTVSGGDGEPMELDVSDNPYDCKSIDISNLPALITLNKLGDCYVVDPSLDEEMCTNAKMMVAVNKSGTVCYSAKSGRLGLEPAMIFDMLSKAKKVGVTLLESLVQHLDSESSSKGMTAASSIIGFLR
ncbi:exosome complex exonuclease RRP42-like [Sycon ciliatum]|uniref:exosome complex exonuclease RRP42-like n=1 Tax=Sycon ciliatum TaxID=27933 RepID=UPI0020AE1B31|eukprot:scpid75214/ scgid12170/ Exosome complex component RRP42; Exosome component 7; Ribosomal RNA-processing protein 42; p8